ncbi:universal stress protein [Halogeometricum limi]|uniref:Nucleotide-binding universal stress protein, UspA family n=1 Tax=Halogeometricum limi TaxID=555875 RepID=A0A1I6FY89_9EURY|nr:universal stress protein [Halogeometricum limi]SFR34874.1 Nucleotide-binding universal stress protein, UspA family [Halogeometricum limi]
MGERVLVPFDGSPLSQRALEHALTTYDDDVLVFYVVDPLLAVYEAETKGLAAAEAWSEEMAEVTADVRAAAREIADAHDAAVTTEVVTGRPARAILAYVADHAIDHVVMGSHGRSGISRLVLGSVAEQVMRQSPVPVTIVR